MGRSRRRKPNGSKDSERGDGCLDCCRAQTQPCSNRQKRSFNIPEKATLYQYIQKPITDVDAVAHKQLVMSDSESEADSAIETGSVTSLSDNSSLFSEHACHDELGSYKSQRSVNGDKCVEVSLNSIYTEPEYEDELRALAHHLTGLPLQKYMRRDACELCERVNQNYYDLEQQYLLELQQQQNAAANVSYLDASGLDIDIHVEEYSNMSLVDGEVQTKTLSYSISAEGSIYYTDVPMRETQILSMPKRLMIPPSERDAFDATHPPQRPWIPLSHPDHSRPTAIFTVMCYNVLCDKYCTRQQYGYSPSWSLQWEYRRKGILEEIRHYNADIVSLQEVETEHFYNFFLPEFEKDGFKGIFAAKSRARTMQESDAKHVDGCAIFWKASKFELITQHVIEFNQLAIANAEGSENILNRVMTKDNIGLCALLETTEGIWERDRMTPPPDQMRQPVLISTAHVIWDPEFCDVKLIQSLMLMSELKNFVEKSQQSFRPGASKMDLSTMPMILCGDLNSLPDSGVVEFLSNGRVSVSHLDFKEIDYEQVLNAFSHTKDKDSLTHAFNLKNAYDDSIMDFTNYTYDFKGIIDYIFFTDNHMNPLGVLGPLDKEWFKENKVVGCPHPHVPSDHFSLIAEFELPVGVRNQPSSARR